VSGLAVFSGPSLSHAHVAAALPWARTEPPACRGDVARLLDEGVDTFLLIDGAFAHSLAVSPGELVAALGAGARVLGASSLGAIRAAECAPAGMEGVGAVAWLYRHGVLRDDDEVAVAVEPEHGYRAASVALINVRFTVLAALRRGLIDRRGAEAVLSVAKGMHFSERGWPAMLATAGVVDEPLLALAEATDVKRRDAELAVRGLADPSPRHRMPAAAVGLRARVVPAARYAGHDPWLGRPPAELAPALAGWLTGSGGYRAYDGLGPHDPPEEMWGRLDRERELGPELMRWYAVERLAAERPSVDGPPLGPFLDAARAEIASAHGHSDWSTLEAALRNPGDRAGARLLARARAAASALALARRNREGPD
jgi:hypothetical protein